MDVAAHFRSLTAELEAMKDRVRSFIKGKHWLTDGEWKESVLRSMIAQRLPGSVKIGRGFVITKQGPTTQCDILIYRADCPVLFRDGDLVFVTPDAVLAIIEVKSKATRKVYSDAIKKLAEIGRKIGHHSEHCCLCLFAYETNLQSDESLLTKLRELCPHETQVISLINLGCSTFIRYWLTHPDESSQQYEQWHAYNLPGMSAGFFISNVLDAISPESVSEFTDLWFPEDSKEFHLLATQSHSARSTSGVSEVQANS